MAAAEPTAASPPAPVGPESAIADAVRVATSELSKHYGDVLAVDRLTFEVRAGEIYGLVGPNGAGKTTTILMLLGLIEPTSGEARVLGMDPARRPLEVKRHVGYVPDAVGFYPKLSGRENLAYTADLNGIESARAHELIDSVLDTVRITDAADRPAETYSRGMLQRLGLADALVKEPAVLILDEPTTAIDPAGVTELLALIRELASSRGLAILLSSHLLHQVERTCDRIGIFSRGRLVAEGSLESLAAEAGVTDIALESIYTGLVPS